MRMMDMDIQVSSVYTLQLVMDMVVKIGLIFCAIAGFDYFYQRWDYEKKIRMSKQELKEEFKQTEGNPEIKGKIRNLQRSRARNRMMQAVPDADVIIRNPTHFAVALKYDIHKNNAPILVAKGQDLIALKIVEIAEKNGVTVIENRPWRGESMRRRRWTVKYRRNIMELWQRFWYRFSERIKKVWSKR